MRVSVVQFHRAPTHALRLIPSKVQSWDRSLHEAHRFNPAELDQPAKPNMSTTEVPSTLPGNVSLADHDPDLFDLIDNRLRFGWLWNWRCCFEGRLNGHNFLYNRFFNNFLNRLYCLL